MVAFAQHTENDLAAILADEDNFAAARANHIQRVTWVVLEENDAAFWEGLLTRQVSELLDLATVKAAEKRHRRQEIGGRSGQGDVVEKEGVGVRRRPPGLRARS